MSVRIPIATTAAVDDTVAGAVAELKGGAPSGSDSFAEVNTQIGSLSTGVTTASAAAAAATAAAAGLRPLRLRHWRAAYANRRYARAVIAGIADSLGEGQGCTAEDEPWLARLAAAYGSDPAEQYRAVYHEGTGLPVPFTVSGTATKSTRTGIGRRSYVLSSGASLTGSFTGTGVDVHYGKDLLRANLVVTIDGTVAATLPTANGTLAGGFVWSSGTLSAGSHTIVLSASGGSARVDGIKPRSGTTGVHLYRGGLFGSQVASWRDNGFGSDVGDNQWPADYAALNPDLVVIALGPNDYFFQANPATYQAGLTFLVTKLRALCSGAPSFLFVIYPKRADDPATITYPYQAYVDAMITAAGSDPDIDVLDLRAVPASGVDTDGLWADGPHPNRKGAQRLADAAVLAIRDPR